MQTVSPAPILQIVDAAEMELARLGLMSGEVGLVGTADTLAMRLYQDRLERSGWHCLTPTPDEMETLILPAIAQVKTGGL